MISMKEKNKKIECCPDNVIVKKHNYHYGHGYQGAIYGLGVIGALFYFLGQATSFGMVVMGIGKAIFWPAILVFKLMLSLGI